MTPLPTRLRCGFPASLAETANRAAYLLDPDTGGDRTYTDANSVDLNGIRYYAADLPIWPLAPGEYPMLESMGLTDYGQVMKTKNPVVWYAVLDSLATERGREMNLSEDDVTALCAAVLFDEELTPDA